MQKERFFFRAVRNAVRNTLVITALAVPVANHEATSRVFKILADMDYGCSSGERETFFPYGVIAVPGAGSYFDEYGILQLTTKEKGRLKAAAYLYVDGYAPTILLLNGRPNPGIELSKEYLKQAVTEVSGGGISLDTNEIPFDTLSINTATNMEELEKYMTDHGINNALIVTDGFHKARSTILACNFRIDSNVESVEDVFDRHGDPERSNGPGLFAKAQEVLGIAVTPWDPKGRIVTAIKRPFIPQD